MPRRLRNVMPRVRLVSHSLRRLPPPTHEGPSAFWQLFLGRFAISQNSLCLRSIPELASSVGTADMGNWDSGFGNWQDDGRAVSHICHSLVRPSLRQPGRHGIQRTSRACACCRWFFSHSGITMSRRVAPASQMCIRRNSTIFLARCGRRPRIHCRVVCAPLATLAGTN